jgi:hypothetical protein
MSNEVPTELIHSGIMFLRDLSQYYGDERAMKLWEELRDGMGREVQNAILMTMLRGNYSRQATVTMSVPREYTKFIEAIKNVRQASGYGLKDAKDFVEMVSDKGPQILKLKDDVEVRGFVQNMKNCGFHVGLM